MAVNRSIEEPDLDTIQREAGIATRNAMSLMFSALEAEIRQRRADVRVAREKLAPKVLSIDPSATQHNFHLEGASLLLLTGAVNRTFTGFRAPSLGESRIVIVFNIGAATYTFAHASGSSDAENRIRNEALSDLNAGTDDCIIYCYLNTLWREVKFPAGSGGAPAAHAGTHQNGGSDEINVAGLSGLLADGQTPLAHATSHQSGGSDAIKLDDFATPDDNTDLNASTTRHGLLKKLSNVATEFLNGVGNWATPTASVAFTEFTKDLGKGRSGTFDLTGLSGLVADKPVNAFQTSAPISSKGNARDEAEMDRITLAGYVVDATTIRFHWQAPGIVVGTYAFAYQVGA